MNIVRIFRHAANEGPGYFAQFLARHGVPYELIAIDQGQAIPDTLDEVTALVFMGGPMSVNDSLPWIADELRLIQQAHRRAIPLLGHCLGGQLISKALGGNVGPNPVKEIGWLPVRRADNVVAQDWLNGLPTTFQAFHWHGETFSIPAGATPILNSPDCDRQGFVVGNTLALQCHIEMTEDMVRAWADDNATEIALPSPTVQSAAQMTEQLTARVTQLQQYAEIIYTRWLRALA